MDHELRKRGTRPLKNVRLTVPLLLVALLFAYARRRVPPPMALLCSLVLLFFGPGWQNFLWPFQLSWLISLAAGVAALLMLDRADMTGSVGAAVMLGVSLASSGIGLPITVGIVVELLLHQGDQLRQLLLWVRELAERELLAPHRFSCGRVAGAGTRLVR